MWEACVLCPKSRARRTHAPSLRRFILLVSFSDTFLVVSILDIAYDYHLRPLWQSWGCYNGSCGNYGSLLARDSPFQAVGVLWAVSRVGGSARVYAWYFTCGFDFRNNLWLPFEAAFSGLRGLLIVPVGTLGLFWPGDGPFQDVGDLWTVSKVENSAHAQAWSSEFYPAGKLQWHFTCGLDFRNSLWLPFESGFAATFAVQKGLTAERLRRGVYGNSTYDIIILLEVDWINKKLRILLRDPN